MDSDRDHHLEPLPLCVLSPEEQVAADAILDQVEAKRETAVGRPAPPQRPTEKTYRDLRQVPVGERVDIEAVLGAYLEWAMGNADYFATKGKASLQMITGSITSTVDQLIDWRKFSQEQGDGGLDLVAALRASRAEMEALWPDNLPAIEAPELAVEADVEQEA